MTRSHIEPESDPLDDSLTGDPLLRLSLLEYMETNIPTEDPQEQRRKGRIVEELRQIFRDWIKRVYRLKKLDYEVAEKAGGEMYISGSYKLGIMDVGVDVDTCCVVPKHITFEDFFSEELSHSFNRLLQANSRVTNYNAVPTAAAPKISFDFDEVEFDLLFACLTGEEVLEDDYDIDRDEVLLQCQGKAITSLNGPRDTNLINKLMQSHEREFVEAVRCVRKWCKQRGLYGNRMGYYGGINCNLIVAKMCQFYPRANSATILEKVFTVLSAWDWQAQPLRLCRDYDAKLNIDIDRNRLPWSKQGNGKEDLMPIICPAYPVRNSTYAVNSCTFEVIMNECLRAKEIMTKIIKRAEDKKQAFREEFEMEIEAEFLEAVEGDREEEKDKDGKEDGNRKRKANQMSSSSSSSSSAVPLSASKKEFLRSMSPEEKEIYVKEEVEQRMESISLGDLGWGELFDPSDFFVHYNYYLAVNMYADTLEKAESWFGFLESQIRFLLKDQFHKSNPYRVRLAHLFPKGFDIPSENFEESSPLICGKTYYIGLELDLDRLFVTGENGERKKLDLNLSKPINAFEEFIETGKHRIYGEGVETMKYCTIDVEYMKQKELPDVVYESLGGKQNAKVIRKRNKEREMKRRRRLLGLKDDDNDHEEEDDKGQEGMVGTLSKKQRKTKKLAKRKGKEKVEEKEKKEEKEERENEEERRKQEEERKKLEEEEAEKARKQLLLEESNSLEAQKSRAYSDYLSSIYASLVKQKGEGGKGTEGGEERGKRADLMIQHGYIPWWQKENSWDSDEEDEDSNDEEEEGEEEKKKVETIKEEKDKEKVKSKGKAKVRVKEEKDTFFLNRPGTIHFDENFVISIPSLQVKKKEEQDYQY